MEPRFADEKLQRLERDARFSAELPPGVVGAFRRRMQQIRAARDERDFYNLVALHFEKLRRSRTGEYSMRLNRQYRLICRFEGRGQTKSIVILRITDYH
jgi:proteic killer suppression protein